MCMCVMEYYLTIKRNEMLLFAAMWIDPQGVMSSARERQLSYDFTYTWNLKKQNE